LKYESLVGLHQLMTVAEEADSGRNWGIAGERAVGRERDTSSESKSWERECTHGGQQTFKIRARLSGSLAVQKITCILQFLLNELKVSVPHYFGTGSTLLRYHGTVWYHQFGSVYFITVRSGWMDGY
jgi:hypothetical protein